MKPSCGRIFDCKEWRKTSYSLDMKKFWEVNKRCLAWKDEGLRHDDGANMRNHQLHDLDYDQPSISIFKFCDIRSLSLVTGSKTR